MFEKLKEIKEAFVDSRFILLVNSGTLKEVVMVIPSQAVRPDHIAAMRNNGGGAISVTLEDNFCRALELPFLDNVYRGISARYPIIERMLSNNDSGNSVGLSLSINHKSAKSGVSDEEKAITIASVGELADKFSMGKISNKEFNKTFSDTFIVPGHVIVKRAIHGLLRRRLSPTELSLALCQITGQAPSTSICEILDSKTNKLMSKTNAIKLAQRENYPVIESQDLIHLWRSIQKVPKSELLRPTDAN